MNFSVVRCHTGRFSFSSIHAVHVDMWTGLRIELIVYCRRTCSSKKIQRAAHSLKESTNGLW